MPWASYAIKDGAMAYLKDKLAQGLIVPLVAAVNPHSKKGCVMAHLTVMLGSVPAHYAELMLPRLGLTKDEISKAVGLNDHEGPARAVEYLGGLEVNP